MRYNVLGHREKAEYDRYKLTRGVRRDTSPAPFDTIINHSPVFVKVFPENTQKKRGNMCSECHKQFCPDSCPQKDVPRYPVCEDCGCELDGCLAYLGHDGNHYCIDCIEGMDVDEILRICGISHILEMLIRFEDGKTEDSNAGLFFCDGGREV